jgi:hypothetical protein
MRTLAVTSQQSDTIKEYENEVRKRGGNAALDWKESNSAESRGVLFADVGGVTLMVYPDGLINIPARCSWSFDKYTHVTAAACAKELWARQKKLDDANRKKAQERPGAPRDPTKRQGGHLDSLVGPDLKCRETARPCHKESQDGRQRRARGALNAKLDVRKEKYRNYSGCP